MSQLVYFTGTMDCGKSTLALQLDHNHAARGRLGVIYTQQDRAGEAVISSRLGLSSAAVEVGPETDFWADVVRRRTRGHAVDYVICDEAQFYSAAQVDQLARLVDEMEVDVFAFGIMTDFRSRLFPGSARLVELADRLEILQVTALCWCGARATHNARTLDGLIVREGEQVVVGDTDQADAAVLGYEVLCRRHHVRGTTARAARATALSQEGLPLDLPQCAVPQPGVS